MTTLTNPKNANLSTTYDTDKIVGIYAGSFDAATQTTSISYTFNGLPYSVWYYEIAHIFTQPVFCDVLTSTDGVTYTNNASIAFSDSTKLYIYAGQGSAPSGTIYYKLVATWINGYSALTPAVTPVIQGVSGLYYKSTANTPKIYLENVVSIVNNATSSVTHNLGYQPQAKVYMECFSGQVWPCHTGGSNDTFLFADSENTGYFYTSSTALTMFCDQNASSFGASRFWYKVYIDT